MDLKTCVVVCERESVNVHLHSFSSAEGTDKKLIKSLSVLSYAAVKQEVTVTFISVPFNIQQCFNPILIQVTTSQRCYMQTLVLLANLL